MNIRRIIDKNAKLIWYIAIIIVFIFIAIRSLNSYYEQDEEKKKKEAAENAIKNETQVSTPIDFSVESDSVQEAMASFVNYCNNRELENAYKMLTEECKAEMFPTIEDFDKIYIQKIFNIKRQYELTKWSTVENRITYLVSFYGDILATGGVDKHYTEEYYTFVEDENGIYKLNINNYIYGETRNIKSTVKNITINIEKVNIYEEYEKANITITNNTSKTICLTGNKYKENICLKNSKGVTYSSLNSQFDSEEILLEPNKTQTYIVEFNKVYSVNNKAEYLVLSDVILDYESYLKNEDKINYSNRTNIKVKYQK